MNETSHTNRACERAAQLIAYLYGETSAAEAAAFEQHLQTCGVCRDELVAFNQLRSDIGVWHGAVLQNAPTLPAVSFETSKIAPQISQNGMLGASAQQTTGRKPSALAAFREFFALSPLWLKAGSLATALALCALAMLAVANAQLRWDHNGIAFSTGARRVNANEPKQTELTRTASDNAEAIALRKQVKDLTTERAAWQAERADLLGKLDKTNNQLAAQANAVKMLNASLQRANGQFSNKPRVVYVNAPLPNRGARTTPRIQEAENNEERDAPRLIDLIGDSKD